MVQTNETEQWQPLAARLRPRCVREFFGQSHLLAEGKPLRQAIEAGHLHSMILWGPPGTGKTTLAKIIANNANAPIEQLSAVMAGVKDIRQVAQTAQKNREQLAEPTVLFVDEVHRFNKAQQDAFLPYLEEGIVTLIGATTENPSFELNNALLSRTRIYVLNALTDDELGKVLTTALTDLNRGMGQFGLAIDQQARDKILQAADGDARQMLNILELASQVAAAQGEQQMTVETLQQVLTQGFRRFDKGGDAFYEQISALHKAVRGSAPNAALYWLVRMLDSGCDPEYIGRRLIRMASEDIGNADPRALTISLDSWQAYERLGSPEGELALAQATLYLAVAPKSNSVYLAYNEAQKDVRHYGSLAVPMHLRNAPTSLMETLGYGKAYRYAHDEPYAYAAGECYFPEQMPQKHYYRPTDRGMEQKINEKLRYLAQLDQQYRQYQSEGNDD
jgi:putative ATPase